VHFREVTHADRDRILALRARCFPDTDPEKHDPRFWDWQFARSRFFVAEEDGAFLSHLGVLEIPHMLDGEIVPGVVLIDAMTSPAARGRGTYSGVVREMMAHRTHVIGTAYQIRKAVLGIMLKAGWPEATRVPVLLRPAPLLARASRFPALSRGDVPWMSNVAMSLLRDGCLARTPEFLAWRFFENPHWKYEIRGVANSAYIVTRRTTLRGFHTLAVVDLAWRDRAVARDLLRDALGTARLERCSLAAALISRRHPAFGMFLRRGFFPGPHWFRLLVHPPELGKRDWRVMWADTDHL
jgi:GNAT superfamily N-acetyltransferase